MCKILFTTILFYKGCPDQQNKISFKWSNNIMPLYFDTCGFHCSLKFKMTFTTLSFWCEEGVDLFTVHNTGFVWSCLSFRHLLQEVRDWLTDVCESRWIENAVRYCKYLFGYDIRLCLVRGSECLWRKKPVRNHILEVNTCESVCSVSNMPSTFMTSCEEWHRIQLNFWRT